MPLQAFPARQGDEGGTRSKPGHVSGRALSGITAVTVAAEGSERIARRQSAEQHAGPSGPLHSAMQAAEGSGPSRGGTASSGGALSSEDSYEAAPLRRRPQPINAELVKLVASFAPLELAQLKAMEQKARLKKTRAPAVAAAAAATVAEPEDMSGTRDAETSTEPQRQLEQAGSIRTAELPIAQPLEPARSLVRPSTADATRRPNPSFAAPPGRTRSQSATRPTHLPAAPAKGAVVKRDLNILPNPVAQKQTEAVQRQAAVSAFVKRLQREQDLLRVEKERRLKAEQDALAAQLDEEGREARAAAAEVTQVPTVPVRRKKPAPPSNGVNTALKDLQAAGQEVPEKKPIDAKPWRQNMRRQRNPPVAGEAPIGAPREVPAKAATGAPPPRNISPGAAAARAKTLDPVSRSQLKEYMERKAKDMAAKQQHEKAAHMEAKAAALKIIKSEMAKARERAQRYAEVAKENPADYKGPRPAWVDVLPAEGGPAAAAPSRAAPSQRSHPGAPGPDDDFVSERAIPYHMSDAMRMEVAERRRQERQLGSASPNRLRGGRPVLVDNFGHSLEDGDWDSGPQVVRVHDPDMPEHVGRVHRASSSRPNRPVVYPVPTTSQPAARPIQVGHPIAPETLRNIELEARLAARKTYEQHQRELQASERRDNSRGRDTSRGRDNSRGRRRSPTVGRKHESASLNSRSRSPPKRAKQQSRRSRSASRAGSANRRVPVAPSQAATAGVRDARQLTSSEYPTAVQAELQQARNERHVGSLWDLALQLSERLGALQQQGLLVAPQQPMQAWPDPHAQFEQQQQPGASLRSSLAGPLLPYPPPVAVVPTGLPAEYGSARQDLARPRHVQQYDEAVEADIDFRTEVSWPIAGHKKMRTTGSSSVGVGADSSIGFGKPRSAGIGAAGSIYIGGPSSVGIRSGMPASLFSGDSSMGGQSREDLEGSAFASDGETGVFDENVSTLTGGLHAVSMAAETTPSLLANMSSGPSQGSLSAHSRDQDAPSLHGKSDPASPAQQAWSINEGGRAASLLPGQPQAPSSPSRQVPAAPIIQIPLLPSTSNAMADSVAPSVAGLPYDNATFSADSADEDGSSSGGESTYGQRVLTIAELHGVLGENPRLSQRMSLDRERDRWEEAFETKSPSRRSDITIRQQQDSGKSEGSTLGRQQTVPLSPSYGGTSEDSFGGSDPGTPSRPCEAVVSEYEQANSPLRLHPAQRELLKVRAAKRAEERLEASDSENSPSGTEDDSDELAMLQLPKSGDPMSIISLIAHKGRLPARPTIIQLSEPPVLDGYSPSVAEQETQTAQYQYGAGPVAQGLTPRRASEVLLIPGPKGPQLVFSRELLHSQQRTLTGSSISPRKPTKETGVGDGRIDHAGPNGSSSQHITDSLPPFVLLSAATSVVPVLQQSPNSAAFHTSRAPSSPSTISRAAVAASMQQQLDMMQSLHQQQLEERGLAEQSARAEPRRSSIPGASQAAAAERPDDGGSGLLGAMASPPPRPRMVTFLDEAQGPPERVRLAPGELFNQMQNTLKTYEELDAADLELQQLQNARAIAAVQREAHRIAQRLDQTAAAEAQLQLIAHTQAEMDAKLLAFGETIRGEVRKDSISHLHDVTSLFVEQLSRNKVVHTHSTAQTTPPPSSPPKPDFGVQVGPPLGQYPVSILRSSSPPQQQPAMAAAATSSRSPSPPHRPQTSLRAISPAHGAQSSLHQPSALPHERSPSRGGSPGPGGRISAVSFQRPSSSSNPTADYSEDFEDSELRQSSYVSGRSASRVSFRQASHLSVPKSVSEEVDEERDSDSNSASEVDEVSGSMGASRGASLHTTTATSIPESVLEYRDRQLSRANNRQTSFASVAESIPSERPTSRSALRQQASTLSIPESVNEEVAGPLSRPPFRSALRQQSTVSIAESVGYEGSATALTHGGRHSSGGGTESVPYSSITGGEAQGYSSIQESLQARHSGRASTILSGASRRRRSAIDEDIPSEPTYSSVFDRDEEERISEEFVPSRTGTRATHDDDDDDYSTDEVESEPSGRRSSQRRRTATTVSTRSAEVEEVIRTGGGSRSYSRDDDVEEDSGLVASGSSPHLQLRPGRPPGTGGAAAPAEARDAYRRDGVGGVMTTPPSARTGSRRGDCMLPGASPLTLRASIDGGLELDDDVMASYAADSETRMRQEVALLQDRLQDINRRAAAKMDQLESELAAEAQPQKRQALIRAQRLLQVQHDADAADIQRQISAVRADYSRQRLMLERLYRLAQLTSPAGALAMKRVGVAPAEEGRRSERARSGAAVLQPRPAERARHVSSSRSIEDDVLTQPSRSASIAEEGGTRRNAHSTTSSIAEEPSRHARRRSSSNSVDEDIPKGSGSTEIVGEYSDEFEPSSVKHSRSQLFTHSSRPPRVTHQSSSIVDDIEESLSGRRLGTSGAQSQSVVTEDDYKRSGSSAAAKGRRPASGSVATESPYSEDFGASGGSAKAPPRARTPPRRAPSTARSDDLGSELSVLSMKLEREKAELARKLQEKRRAKLLIKQAEVEEMRARLAALGGTAPRRTAPVKRRPSTGAVDDPKSSVEDEVGGYSRSGLGDSGSKTPSTVLQDDAQSVAETEVEDSDIPDDDDLVHSAQQSSYRSRDGATESGSPDGHATSSSPSREPVDLELSAAEKAVAMLAEQVLRAKQARLEAAQHQKRQLEAQLKALTTDQPVSWSSKSPHPSASEPRRTAAGPSAARSQGATADSASYSQDFTASGSAASRSGARSSSIVTDEVQQSTLQRTGSQAASGSRTISVSEERISSIPQSSRGVGSHSGSVLDDETQRAGLHSSRSSGGEGGRGTGRASNSGEVYNESSETDSVRGGSILQESSDIRDEAGPSDVPSSSDLTGTALEVIREEDVRSVSGRSISYAADSVIDQSVRESVADQGSDTGFGGFQAQAGDTRSIEESGYAAEDVQPTDSHSIEDAIEQFSVASDQSAASQSVRDEQEFSAEDYRHRATPSGTSASMEVEVVPSGDSQSGSQDRSKDSQQVLSEEFLTTADINTHSVTPSIHSAELEAANTSSVPTAATQSAISQETTIPMAEFLTSADTSGDSVTPSIGSSDLAVVQESSLQDFDVHVSTQDLEEEEPLVVTQKSSSSSSSSSDSVSEEGAGPSTVSRSAEVLETSGLQDVAEVGDEAEVSELEVDYSEIDGDTADIEVGEPEEVSDRALRSQGRSGLGQPSSVGEEAVEEDEYSLDGSEREATGQDSDLDMADEAGTEDLEGTRAINSADVVEDPAMQRSAATASADTVSDGAAQRSAGIGSTSIASDVPGQPSVATGSTTASALPEEESQVEDYELDFQPSALEVPGEESSRKVLGTTGTVASASRLMSTGDVVQEEPQDEEEGDYEDDFQPSALEVEMESSPHRVFQQSSSEEDEDEVEDYELDFQSSVLEVPAEESSRKVLGPLAASASANRLESTSEMVQDASELPVQSSLRDVASTSSFGSRRLPDTSQASAKALPSSLQQQASSVSAATYEEDFEEGEASDLQLHGLMGAARTTLSIVVEEEGETKPRPDATGSMLYSEDQPATATQQSLPTVNSVTESAASEVQDLEYDFGEMGVEEDEDEQQFSAGSTGLVGPVLPPTVTSVALEVSQRYGPASEQSSRGYSDDFTDQPGQDPLDSSVEESGGVPVVDPTSSFALTRDADKGLQPLMSEPRAESSLHKLAFQSAERRVSAASAAAALHEPPPPAVTEPSASRHRPAQEAQASVSILSVEEELSASATVSSEPSAQELSQGPNPKTDPQEAKAAAAQAMGATVVTPQASDLGADDDGEDDYTQDFTDLHSNVEAQSSSNAAPQEPEKDTTLVSHPISQPPSPPARSDGGASSRAGTAADAEGIESEEVLDEEDLDMSDLGLDTPLAAALAAKETAAGEAPSGAGADARPSVTPALRQPGGAEDSSISIAGEVEAEESGIIAVPRGMGIRQTRKIESRTWRNQQALLEEEEGGLSGDVDLVDMSMPGGEGSGLLDMLGADLITEASEVNTPSHSFRVRSGDLASAPSSGSPFGMRSALSVRLATLRESRDHEGEDTATNSEVVSPLAGRALQMSGDNVLDSQRSEHATDTAVASQDETAEEASEVADEEAIPSQLSNSEGSFLQPTPLSRAEQPPEPGPEQPAAGPVATAAEPLPEPSGAIEAAVAAREQPGREASGESIARYSDDLEAPPSEASAGRQSVLEYDMYASAALAGDDSDELMQVAAAFESQAIGGVDEDDDGDVEPEYSGISASGLSDDMAKYKVAIQPDSDEEAGDGSRAAPAAVVAAPAAAAPSPSSAVAPTPAPHEDADDALSDEASEVADEEPDAAASDPFSVDESDDHLPTLLPAAAAQPPAPLLATAAQASAAAQRSDQSKSEMEAKTAPVDSAAGGGPVAPSPTASSPRSERSSHGALPDETSLGPLPRSGLGGDDEEEEQGLEYRAVYKPHGDGLPKPESPVPADTDPAAGLLPGEEAPAAAAVDGGSGGKDGYLQQLRSLVGSDDEDDDRSGSVGGRRLSAASLKPVFQALLDQPDAEGDVPKGDFESEIEEMLAASRSRSRLASPHQSRDWAPDADAQEQDGNTPSSSRRASFAGILPAATVLAAQTAGAEAAASGPASREAQERAGTPKAEHTRDNVVDEITESTVKELVADAVEVMMHATGQGGSPFQTASTAAASAGQASSRLPALSTQGEVEGVAVTDQALEDSRVSMGGEESISMSVDDLDGDIELGGDAGLDAGAGLDLPSPIPSDSGSVGSPMRSYGPGALKLSEASGPTPALGPERSDRDLTLSSNVADETLGTGGVGLNSDEDLGWGDDDLEDDWQPDLSGLISPEIDQAAIERENAPAVATGAAAVEEYAGQVLEQFMDNRPEFLVPGAEPLSLEGFLDQERRLVHASEAQHIHNKMTYDAINEALLAIYRAANRVESQPWLRRNRIIKPLPSPAEMARQVQQQLRAWAAMRMRDPAETDKVLAMDAQEDERARGDLAQEEAEVQREVADLIWADLIEDTARQLADLEQLLAPASSARNSMPGSGRRRMDALAS